MPSRFLRGTRGWPVVIGFVVVLLALFAGDGGAEIAGAAARCSARPSTFSALAVLVIFQPELRRMLAELGNLPLFATAHEQRESIEVIIQTVERLADVKIGALIAIEQSIQLQEAVESGVRVDCEATPEMLETIFFPNNAIHDGGVIIKGDRIAYAACIFPLTQRQDLNKSLGTRHRAAIGLSEETDAVIVVVSEETGMISHAYKGQLVRGVTLEELRAFLTSVLLQPAKSHTSPRGCGRGSVELPQTRPGGHHRDASAPGGETRRQINFKPMRDWFIKDLGWKLFSLVLAVGIWLVVNANRADTATEAAGARDTVTFENLPVRVLSGGADVHEFKVQPPSVAVTVTGPHDIMSALQEKEVHVTLNITGIAAKPQRAAGGGCFRAARRDARQRGTAQRGIDCPDDRNQTMSSPKKSSAPTASAARPTSSRSRRKPP